jgi:thiol-disulfide isomerase/thioredoxin
VKLPRLPLLFVAGVALLLGAASAAWLWSRHVGEQAEADEWIAPGFLLPDLSGQQYALSDWRGKVLLVNFWASWCEPCRREIPAFTALQQRYGEEGVQVVGIGLDDAAKIAEFFRVAGIDPGYPQLMAPGAGGVDLAIAWGNAVGVLPYTVFVDRAGRIAHAHYGELTLEDAASRLEPLL